ncbi:hypothetical protein BDV98DRAFT_554133, partial [Pterulicium gracile]
MSPHISPFPSPVSPPVILSDSSDDENGFLYDGAGPSVSRPGSPGSGAAEQLLDEDDVATCRWNDCGRVFHHLPTLIDHIHNDHIGNHRSNYTCEWTTCTRRGLPQTSRFALTSHIRSHTGEKPFTCPKPECDKSFTRSDALAKHMRLQHNLDPPLPGRGGSRKRKRGGKSPSPEILPGGAGTSTFKVDVNPDPDEVNGLGLSIPPENGQGHVGEQLVPGYPSSTVSRAQSGAGSDSEDDSSIDPLYTLPGYLQKCVDPATGLVYKRSPTMVRYLIEKAKYRFAMEEHEGLVEELSTLRRVLAREMDMKEKVMDEVLKKEFGYVLLVLWSWFV